MGIEEDRKERWVGGSVHGVGEVLFRSRDHTPGPRDSGRARTQRPVRNAGPHPSQTHPWESAWSPAPR